MYQMAMKLPVGRNIYQMAMKYSNIFHYKAFQYLPKMVFWIENLASGNPGSKPEPSGRFFLLQKFPSGG
jgi:hypothetical protein